MVNMPLSFVCKRCQVLRSKSETLVPPLPVVRLNVDASQAVDGWIGLELFIARNSVGGVLCAASRHVLLKHLGHPK